MHVSCSYHVLSLSSDVIYDCQYVIGRCRDNRDAKIFVLGCLLAAGGGQIKIDKICTILGLTSRGRLHSPAAISKETYSRSKVFRCCVNKEIYIRGQQLQVK